MNERTITIDFLPSRIPSDAANELLVDLNRETRWPDCRFATWLGDVMAGELQRREKSTETNPIECTQPQIDVAAYAPTEITSALCLICERLRQDTMAEPLATFFDELADAFAGFAHANSRGYEALLDLHGKTRDWVLEIAQQAALDHSLELQFRRFVADDCGRDVAPINVPILDLARFVVAAQGVHLFTISREPAKSS